jgi:hypothetical protein
MIRFGVRNRSSLICRLAATLVILGAMSFGPAHADVLTNLDVPVASVVSDPCSGEQVALTGRLHLLVSLTSDSGGGVHTQIHSNPQGVEGTALTSGTTYVGNGMTRLSININGDPPLEFTFVNNFHLISPGKAPNISVHATTHMVINANGDITADVVSLSVDCD